MRRVLLSLAVIALASGCQRPVGGAQSAQEFRQAVAGVEWQLMEVAGQPAPMGAGNRRATIRFDADSSRAGGFAGCNRWSGSYTLEGTALRFGPIITTKMACAQGMELEQRMVEALDATRRVERTNDQLTFFGDAGAVAKFSR